MIFFVTPKFWGARDQTQPGSLFSRSGGRGERDPGNEVGYIGYIKCADAFNMAATEMYGENKKNLKYWIWVAVQDWWENF